MDCCCRHLPHQLGTIDCGPSWIGQPCNLAARKMDILSWPGDHLL